jgi:hypothetical protein
MVSWWAFFVGEINCGSNQIQWTSWQGERLSRLARTLLCGISKPVLERVIQTSHLCRTYILSLSIHILSPAIILLFQPILPASLTSVYVFMNFSLLEYCSYLPYPVHYSNLRAKLIISFHGFNTPWPESASELYRPSDRRLLAKLVPTFADRRCHVVSVTDPHGRILAFLYRSHYVFFHVAPQLYSRGWVDPVPDPLLLSNSGNTENRTRTSGSVARNSDR